MSTETLEKPKQKMKEEDYLLTVLIRERSWGDVFISFGWGCWTQFEIVNILLLTWNRAVIYTTSCPEYIVIPFFLEEEIVRKTLGSVALLPFRVEYMRASDSRLPFCPLPKAE